MTALRSRLWTWGVVAVVVVCALIALDSVGGSSPRHELKITQFGQLLPVSQRQPVAFHGSLLDGASFRSQTDAGKVLVVNFWASWCSPCTTEIPQFEAVAQNDAALHEPVQFVGINTKDTRSGARNFIGNNHVTYPNVFDEAGAVSVEMGGIPVSELPYTVLVDKHGRAAGTYLGAMTPNDLNPMIAALLSES